MRVLLVVLFACCTAWAARAAPARGLEVRYRPPAGLEQGLVGETLLYRKSHAIVIGIDAYGKLPALTGAVRDARNVAEAFRARGMDVTLLLDREATRARITELLGDELPGRLGEQDRVLIYFAGHGISVGQGERAMGYLMPVNGDRAKVRSSGISMREIQAWFADYASKHVMFVADACYSGLALSTRAAGLPPTIPEYLRRVLAKRVRLALTAGGAGEEAHEWRGEGLFTHYFLEGINGAADANRDGLVTSDELAAYVKPNVAQTAIDQFRASQNPLMGRSGEGEFLFLASARAPGAVVSTGITLRPSAPAPAAAAGAVNERALELEFWNSIKASDDPDVFEAYLAQYPQGTFAGLARINRDKLRKQLAAAVVPPKLVFDVEAMDEAFTALKTANVRGQPTTRADKIGTLTANSEVAVTGKTSAGGATWYRVALADGALGYVFGNLLKEGPPTVQPAVGIYPHDVGDMFQDCAKCPEMVVVPAGGFMMGYKEHEQHRVIIPRPFAVGVYEVTFREWDACVAAGGCDGYHPDDEGWGRGRRPVMHLNWKYAQDYAAWLSRKTRKPYRLLSDSEWEYVARAGTATKYNTGNSIATSQANYKESGNRKTVVVGSYGANAFGLHDVHGNVWEWVEDCTDHLYKGVPSGGSALTSGRECENRLLRSGGWGAIPRVLRSAMRNPVPAWTQSSVVGFRVARNIE